MAKLGKRGWFRIRLMILMLITGAIAFGMNWKYWKPAERLVSAGTVAKLERSKLECLLIGAAIEQWQLEQSARVPDLAGWRTILMYLPSRDGEDMRDGKDALGNPFLLVPGMRPPQMHPRTELISEANRQSFPFPQFSTRSGPTQIRLYKGSIDLLASLLRAVQCGDLEKVKELKKQILSDQPDWHFAGLTDPKEEFKATARTSAERQQRFHQATLSETVAEADSIRKTALLCRDSVEEPPRKGRFQQAADEQQAIIQFLTSEP